MTYIMHLFGKKEKEKKMKKKVKKKVQYLEALLKKNREGR